MERLSAPMKEPSRHKSELQCFIRSLKNSRLNKKQIKTLRGQAVAGDLVGARKGLERIVNRYVCN